MKLPHWALVVLSLVSVVLAWVASHAAAGDIVLPAVLLGAIPTVQAVIGLLTDSVPSSLAAKRALRSAAGPVVALLALAAGGYSALAVLACSSAQVAAGTVASVDLAACILSTASADAAAGMQWPAIVADTALKCGTDAATVGNVWASHVHAEVTEGFVPKMPVPDGGK